MKNDFRLLQYGEIPVPWTVSWSAEKAGPHHVAIDAHHKMPAIFAPEARGEGKPLFANPHDQRLRRAMREQRCDLCGQRFGVGETKISLSREQHTDIGNLQTEPMVHRACGIVSLSHCPRLQAQMRDGTLRIRQVTKFRLACSFLTAEAVRDVTGEEWPDGVVMGALKYQIDNAIYRSLDWLLRPIK